MLTVTGGTETWKNPQTKEKYIFYHVHATASYNNFNVDSAAEEYNAFFYSLVSSVSV